MMQIRKQIHSEIGTSFNNTDVDLEGTNITGTRLYVFGNVASTTNTNIYNSYIGNNTFEMILCDLINEVLETANVTIDANLTMAPKSKILTLNTSIANTAIDIDGVNIRNEEFVNNILTVDNITVGRSHFYGDNAIVQTTTFSFGKVWLKMIYSI